MEEDNNKPVASDEPIVLGGEKKTSKGMIAGLIVLAIVAVAGIAFGIIELMQVSNKDKEIADLNQQVANCANAGNTETENTTVTCPDGTSDEDKNAIEIIDTEDYIYIGEWGIKIKIPEDLANVSYMYLDDGYHRSCRVLEISASTVGDGTKPAFVKTGGDKGDFLGSVMRCPKEDIYPYGSFVFEDSDFNFYYDSIQYSITQTEWETESVQAVKNMITNRGNYSKI